jgi:hypothetical protein
VESAKRDEEDARAAAADGEGDRATPSRAGPRVDWALRGELDESEGCAAVLLAAPPPDAPDCGSTALEGFRVIAAAGFADGSEAAPTPDELRARKARPGAAPERLTRARAR